MKKKVRFFISTLEGGGAERVLVDLLTQLDLTDYDVSLLTLYGGVYRKRIPANIRYKCIIKGKNIFSRLLFKLLLHCPKKLFVKLFFKEKYDVEIAYLEGIPTRFLAALKRKVVKIAFIHCDISSKNIIAPFYRDNDECLKEYKSYSKVCFVSKKCQESFETIIGNLDNAHVIHNVLDYERIKRMSLERNSLDYVTKGLKLITVGRLAPEKNYACLLNVIAELEKKYDFELWILGEGDERKNLENIISIKQIKSVRLLGFKTNPYSYIRKADWFISSSLSEGYSTVALESIALGVPVLTTNTAGMQEILEGKYGKIVENSEKGLIQGLTDIFENQIQYDCFKNAVVNRSKNLNCREILDEYMKLIS